MITLGLEVVAVKFFLSRRVRIPSKEGKLAHELFGQLWSGSAHHGTGG